MAHLFFNEREKGVVGELDAPNLLHSTLTLLLLVEQLHFPRNVTAVALFRHILAQST